MKITKERLKELIDKCKDIDSQFIELNEVSGLSFDELKPVIDFYELIYDLFAELTYHNDDANFLDDLGEVLYLKKYDFDKFYNKHYIPREKVEEDDI